MECTCSDTDYEDYKKLRKRVDDIIVELTNGKLYRMLTSELVPVVCFFLFIFYGFRKENIFGYGKKSC